jgi:hypothetical protein
VIQQASSTTEGTVRFLRIVHVALLVSVILYGIVLRMVPVQNQRSVDPPILIGLYALSVVMIAIGLAVRAKFIRSAFETLRAKPDDAASLVHWRKADMVSAVLAEAVVLYGVAIHFLGGSVRQVAPFFVFGAIVMLI